MRISIIVTNHNYAHFLGEALASAVDQTLPPCEVVVVDDASTDVSRADLAARGDRIGEVPLIVVHTGGPDGGDGQWRAAMAGVERSTGELIVFLDADDLLTRDALERHAAAFASDPACVVSMGRMVLIDRDGQPIAGGLFDRSWPSGDLTATILAHGRLVRWPYTTGNAWRRDVVIAGRDFQPDVRNALDGFLHAIAPLLGTYRDTGTVVARYRVHGKNMSLTEGIDKLTQSAREEAEKLRGIAEFARRRSLAFDPDGAVGRSLKQIRNFLSWHLLGAADPAGLRPMTLLRAWSSSLAPRRGQGWWRHWGWLLLVSLPLPALRRRLCFYVLTVIPPHVEATARKAAARRAASGIRPGA